MLQIWIEKGNPPPSVCSTTAVRRMGLTAAPSLSSTLRATPAVSLAWRGRSSLPHRRQPDPSTPPNPRGGNAVTAPPAHPMTRPFTFAPRMRCATAESASPTCLHTMRTRRWRCRCPPSEDPCWGRRIEAGLRTSTPTPEPSAPRCDHPKETNNSTHTHAHIHTLLKRPADTHTLGNCCSCQWGYFA